RQHAVGRYGHRMGFDHAANLLQSVRHGGAPTYAHARPFRSVVCGVTKRLRPRAPRPPDRSASAQDKRPGANRVTTPTTRRYGEEPAARGGCEKLRAASETACDF